MIELRTTDDVKRAIRARDPLSYASAAAAAGFAGLAGGTVAYSTAFALVALVVAALAARAGSDGWQIAVILALLISMPCGGGVAIWIFGQQMATWWSARLRAAFAGCACPRCGYNTSALPDADGAKTCPECGTRAPCGAPRPIR